MLAFDRLWERGRNPETKESCTIITAAANELMAPIRERMVILYQTNWA